MFISNVSSKGQITLPAAIRKKLGIKPGDRVLIKETMDSLVIKRAPSFFDFAGIAGKALPPEEERRLMEQAVAEHVNQSD